MKFKHFFLLIFIQLIIFGCKKKEIYNNQTDKSIINTLEMIKVEGGTFQMGNSVETSNGSYPIHTVTVNSYEISKYEVTQLLWETLMDNNPSSFKGNNLPVENINWSDAQTFILKLNQNTGLKYRLPSEAEWEFAARGGNNSKDFKYSGSNSISDVATEDGNSTKPVGSKQPNELGIYDMTGNVWEWCYDWYSNEYYSISPSDNPQGPDTGTARIIRGGGWSNPGYFSRVTNRGLITPDSKENFIGFRLARTL